MKSFLLALALFPALLLAAPDGNRLTYLDESGPYYPHLGLARLTTPQWAGEPGVDAVVILSIDDLRAPEKWEAYLRPILERLKKIDGRSPFSVMCCETKPEAPLFQTWLHEGVSLEVHTLAHPCPLLGKADFATAEKTVLGGLDLLWKIPGNRPLAYRMPCCDSMNSPSPRFYAEIFPQRTPDGHLFTADSSVMNLLTPDDPALPAEITREGEQERFRKYFPVELVPPRKLTFERFGGYIENYPYPYIVNGGIWEFPCAVPSDWEAFNTHGAMNPRTTADWKAALDATVIKQGTMTMVLHPHGWSSPQQIIELIDYAASKYGKRVKFLNFREAVDRLEKNVLGGQSLRTEDGADNGIRLADLDGDGFMDVLIGNRQRRISRHWDGTKKAWEETWCPVQFVRPADAVHLGVIGDNAATLLAKGEKPGAWHFENGEWQSVPALMKGLENVPFGPGVRLRDFDADGACELLVSTNDRNEIHTWSEKEQLWSKADYALPPGISLFDAQGRDNGVRFVDLNADGIDDVLFSNADRFGIYLWAKTVKPNLGWKLGWSHLVREGPRTGAAIEPPPIVRDGPHPDNGAWFRAGRLLVQNEDTAKLDAVTDVRSFKQLIAYDIPPPTSPEEGLRSMRVRKGFQVELVAAEPLVQDPVAFEWDARGRLWVVEMRDYPLGLDGKNKPGGVVKILEDTNGDGKYDKVTVFLEGIAYPNGVLPWGDQTKNSALISDAPEVFLATDTNGDGKADEREAVYSGFIEGNQQHRVNGFEYGLDNWIYLANGDSGGKVTSKKTGVEVDLRGHDVRLRPKTGEIEVVEGQTQFGRHCDDWGHWFGNNNSRWVWDYPIPERYLVRNPQLVVKNFKHELPAYNDFSRVYPAAKPALRFNDPQALGHVTSGNSATPYRDDLFGPDFATSVFISEPVHNAVHREVLEPDGVTFTSHRASGEETSEFFASTDGWSRPTMIKTGPDGALYVADMYRFVIEHPEWIAPEAQQRLDLRAGEDKGRIYRIAPAGAARRPIPDLTKLDLGGLVAALDSPGGWQRTTAQRLLLERIHTAQDAQALSAALTNLYKTSKNPKARLHAIATYYARELNDTCCGGLSEPGAELLKLALHDPHPGVREHAVRLCEDALDYDTSLLEAVAPLADDPEIRVRYQAAFSLGYAKTPRAGELLARIALRDGADYYVRTAVLSSAVPHIATLMQALLAASAEKRPLELTSELIAMTAADARPEALQLAMRFFENQPGAERWQFGAAATLLDALERRGRGLSKLRKETAAPVKEAVATFDRLLTRAQAAVQSGNTEQAVAALPLLGRVSEKRAAAVAAMSALLTPRSAAPLQSAAITALGRMPTAEAAPVFLQAWSSLAPAQRQEVLSVFLARKEGVQALLDAIEAGKITRAQIPPTVQQPLLRNNDAAIRERAAHLLQATGEDRQQIVQRYLTSLPAKGDVTRGRDLFRTNCTPCHRLKGDGTEVGPDLGMMAGKPADQILTAILDPNQAIEQRYIAYTATAKDGRAFAGVIASDTANALTLRAAAGLEQSFLRADLKELVSTDRSLMPEGFEQALTPAQMADVIEYLRTP